MPLTPPQIAWLQQERQRAWRRYYEAQPKDDYDKGQRWAILATFDRILSHLDIPRIPRYVDAARHP
jgi:hypothetical protein